MLLSEFSLAEKIIPCPRKIIFNNCEQTNMLGDILNAGDNVDDQEDYGFTGSFHNITPTVIYDYTKKKWMNIQLENLISQRNIENDGKQYDEIYQINTIDDKEYNEIDQIGKHKEETLNRDIENLILRKFSSQKEIDYLEKYYDEINQMDMSDDKEYVKRDQISKIYEEKVTEDIEVLKLVKLRSQKNIDNIEK